MNLPNLPTDNLYKFMALSGVLLIIFSMTLISTFYYLTNEERYKVSKEIEEVKTEKEFLKKENKLKEKYISYLKNIKPRNKKIIQEIYKTEIEILENEKKIRVKTKNTDISFLRIDEITNDLIFLFIIFMATITAGMMLSSVGFKKWNEKVQKYLDINIQKGSQ